jgi:hypothetical protein
MEKKLELKRKTISVLSDDELKRIDGGEDPIAPVTTSFGNCTGFTCCDDTESYEITIIVTFLTTFTIGH